MKSMLVATTLCAGLVLATATQAQAPAGSTGACKDGTYTDSAKKSGACAGHGGVKEWYGAAKSGQAPAKTNQATAPVPAGPAPAGSTGTCKDGTYTDSAKKKGACAGHGGVKEWYSTGASKSTGSTPATSQAPAAIPAAAAPAAAASSAPAKPASSPAPTPTQAVAGGGPGKVWVNTESKVYHCPGDRYYGKTKQGEYMSESEAKAMGGRASNGRSCS